MRILKNRRLWLALAAIGLLLAARYAGLGDYLSLETLRQNRAALTAFVGDNFALAALAYIGVYVVSVAVSLPGAVFLTIAGGFLFGALWGTLFTVLGATTGATLVFLFAKVIFGANALERLGPQAVKLSQNIKQNAWSYLLVLRFVPLFPFFVVNVIPAFAGVGLPTYVLTTLFGITPGTAVFSSAGAGLGSVLDQGGEISAGSILTPEIIAALVGLALLSLAAIPLRKRFAPSAKAPQELSP
jgi:uncharacterized membrane protein YdjX (TVP38/TMEM64 family)